MASNPPSTDTRVISATTDRLLETVEGLLGRPLTDAERLSFTTRLASINTSAVAPGDLITADLFNALRADVNDLAMRVASVEAINGGPVIDRILPEGATIRAGSLITIVGRNFASAPRMNKVFLDGVEISGIRLDSTPSELSLPIPATLAGLPRSVDITVETPDGRRSPPRPLRIEAQARIQDGSFLIQPAGGPTGNVVVGAVLSFLFDITAQTLFEDRLTLTVQLTKLAGATEADWRNSLAFAPPSPLPIQAGQTRRVTVTVQVPAGASAADLLLLVTGEAVTQTGGTLSAQSETAAIRVGAPVPVSDPRLRFDLDFGPFVGPTSDVRPGPVTIGGITGPGIHVRAGRRGALIIRVTDLRSAGGPVASLQHSAQFDTTVSTNWTITLTPTSGQVAAGDNRDIQLDLLNRAGNVGDTAILRYESRQTSTSGGLTTYTGFKSIPVLIVS
jgi:hypothetical protein